MNNQENNISEKPILDAMQAKGDMKIYMDRFIAIYKALLEKLEDDSLTHKERVNLEKKIVRYDLRLQAVKYTVDAELIATRTFFNAEGDEEEIVK